MKVPRDVSGADLVRALRVLGYTVTRSKGSHMRLTTQQDGEHHETIPAHAPLKTGTLAALLKGIAQHHHISVDVLLSRLDL